MMNKVFTAGIAALVCAAPAAAQSRGTMEFGAFGSSASFDNALSLKTGYGGGGRIGMFLDPRWSLEFENAEMRATRPNGLKDVNVGILSGRVVGVPFKRGALSLLTGAGAGVSTETHFMHSYGVDLLAGAKFALNDRVALRVDGVFDWLANENWKSYRSVRAGVTLYRNPSRATRTVAVTSPMAMPMAHADSVSAMETRRLRARDAALSALRDSLSRAPGSSPSTSATNAAMQAQIHFAFDKSELTDSAKAILDEKVALFRANPTMSITILGHTDNAGTDAYNMALGTRRAQAATSYIVSRGIEASRVIVGSRGESQPITDSRTEAGDALNRRAMFRLIIAPDFE
jgi:peptidoglycan-associated lipoprotein